MPLENEEIDTGEMDIPDRVRRFSLGWNQIIPFFNSLTGKPGDFHQVVTMVCDAIPEGSKVVGFLVNDSNRSMVVYCCHPSFERVAPGAEVPLINDISTEYIKTEIVTVEELMSLNRFVDNHTDEVVRWSDIQTIIDNRK